MKKIYPGDDFSVKLPDYIAGKELPDGSSVSVKIFTINQTESYSFSITENPLPKTVELSSDVLIYMTSGVVQGMMTVNIPDTDMDDSFYNYTRILTTDLFWVNKNSAGQSLEELNNKINALDASVHANYYTMSATDHLLDLLWSDVAASYVDDSELFAAIDAEDASVKSAIAAIPIPDMSDYYNKSAVDGLISDLDSSIKSNYYTKNGCRQYFYTKSEINDMDDLVRLWVNNAFLTKLDATISYCNYSYLQKHYYDNTQVYNKSDIDSSVSGNYYNKTSVDGFISGIDSSVSANYYNKSQIDASIGSIQTALNSIIND